MLHRQSTVIEIVKSVTSEMDFGYSEVLNGLFPATTTAKQMWVALFNAAISWLLSKQINGQFYSSLVNNIDVVTEEAESKTLLSKVNLSSYGLIEGRYNLAPFSEVIAINDNKYEEYKVESNIKNIFLYLKKPVGTQVKLSYMTDAPFVNNLQDSAIAYDRFVKSDNQICLLDKNLVIKAIKCEYFKKAKKIDELNLELQVANQLVESFLTRGEDVIYSKKITIGSIF